MNYIKLIRALQKLPLSLREFREFSGKRRRDLVLYLQYLDSINFTVNVYSDVEGQFWFLDICSIPCGTFDSRWEAYTSGILQGFALRETEL